MNSFGAGLHRQLTILRRVLDYSSILAISPLSTIMFIAIVRSVGRGDLAEDAVIAIALITGWTTGLHTAGDSLARDRMMGLFELDLAAPAAFQQVVLGRVTASTMFSLSPLLVCFAIGQVGYGIVIVDTASLLGVAVVTLASGWATLSALFCMSSIALLSGRSTALMNGLSYPLFLLAGVFVPVALLPAWIHPLSSLVFLRWSAEGFRSAAQGEPILVPIVWLFALGTVMLFVGFCLLDRVTEEMRRTGTVGES